MIAELEQAFANLLLIAAGLVFCLLSFGLIGGRYPRWAGLCLVLSLACIVVSLATNSQ